MRRAAPALLVAALAVACAPAGAACRASSGPKTLPVVELYTAEGCSDCPPADRWLSQLARGSTADNAALLAFHVDYWDQEGWPDPFADARHSRRQELRIALAGKRVTYTPQVMIARNTNVKWREAEEVRRLLRREASRVPPLALSLQAQPSARTLRVQVEARAGQQGIPGGEALVWLALYQDGLTSRILEGENKGKTLHHNRVVRALAGPWRMQGTALAEQASIPLPADADPGKMGLVLFAESPATGDGLQAVSQSLAGCLAPG